MGRKGERDWNFQASFTHNVFIPLGKFCMKHSPIIDWPLTLCHKQGTPGNWQWRLQRGRGSGGHCLVSFFLMAAPGSVDLWRSWQLFSHLFPMPTWRISVPLLHWCIWSGCHGNSQIVTLINKQTNEHVMDLKVHMNLAPNGISAL